MQSYRQIRARANAFRQRWQHASRENAEAQTFLNEFFEIFGIDRRRVAAFEERVRTDTRKGVGRIDLFWPGVLLVEMKSRGKDLTAAYRQALDYLPGLKDEELPQYILVSDLNTFELHELDGHHNWRFTLNELPDNIHLFDFMQGRRAQEITEYSLNEKAAHLLAQLHDALEEAGFTGHALQVFMVRILFCLFAEDTGVFARHQFTRYLLDHTREDGSDLSAHLMQLFEVLDTPESARMRTLPEMLAAFPYVNGHLFAERLPLPFFDAAMRETLLECCYFNWKDISPAIFGSLFQGIMDKAQRRQLGAHYTSEENILKLIGPLFLDDLHAELEAIKALSSGKRRETRIHQLMDRIRALTVFDPACGCGNFLIVTYRALRRIELTLLKLQHPQAVNGQGHLDMDIQPLIPLSNFHGIEIEEWPARIAEVAMWLTQHQMNVEFARAFGREPDLLPLKDAAHIVHGNALTLDWQQVIPADQVNYVIGNPPFRGSKLQNKQQKAEQQAIFGNLKGAKQLDYVANWFYKAVHYLHGQPSQFAFVATSSITQGEQVGVLWPPILALGWKIAFAHRTFAWHNDARGKAAVHCVIVGLSQQVKGSRRLFDYPDLRGAPVERSGDNINPYLIDGPDVVVTSRSRPLCPVPEMVYGNKPVDGGHLFLSPTQRNDLLTHYPQLEPWIRPVLGADEFINRKARWCLWLAEATPHQLRQLMQIPEIKQRIEAVRQMRLNSRDAGTRKHADHPWTFRDTRTPDTYILVPRVTSERRPYVPMGFFTAETIATDANLMIPNATLYHFGILTSRMHMDWMRTVAGRLKSDYRYSAKLVYNNFPWPEVDGSQQSRIEQLAQQILTVRQRHFDRDPGTTLADLYDPLTMPADLRKAHEQLDKAVDRLYDAKGFRDSLSRVRHLFVRYQTLVSHET